MTPEMILGSLSIFALVALLLIILRRPRGQRSWKAWTPTLRVTVVGLSLMFLSSVPHLFALFSVFVLYPIGITIPNSIAFQYVLWSYPYQFIVFILGLLTISLAFSILIADTAKRKGRSWAAFFWLSVLVSPIIMGIIVASLGQQSAPHPSESSKPSKDDQSLEYRLLELNGLKDKGVVSEEEFAQAKKKILGI